MELIYGVRITFGCIGFSDADVTWLPLHPNYKEVNVEAEAQLPSHLNVYKALVQARSDVSIMYGTLNMKVLGKSVFAFTRYVTELSLLMEEYGKLKYISNNAKQVYNVIIIILKSFP